MRKLSLLVFLSLCLLQTDAQNFFKETKASRRWVKKQFRKLNDEQKIAQLFVIRAHSNLGADHVAQVEQLIKKYNIGSLCFFQGGPVRQAQLSNYYQSIAQTPLMICIDGEWGLGMRLDSVINFPRQLMMGAVTNKEIIYKFGKAVGEQCKRMGIHVNYAPDVDVNNNPNNPVINDRSFGEDKYKVAMYGLAYMQGMQDAGIMACAKHFPGHGDVAVDSHYDLPIINKSKAQLDSLELFPFKALIDGGVGSVMIAHLYVPAIDTTANLATTLSKNNVTSLLKEELGYKGITFTDALEMKGVTKFFPAGEAAVQALIAGNDMLCLPGDVENSILKISEAIKSGKLSWDDINARVKKVLLAKYNLGLHKKQMIDTSNLVADLNKATNAIRGELSKQAITLLRKENLTAFPLQQGKKIAYISIGANGENTIARNMRTQLNADLYLFGSKSLVGKELMDDRTGFTAIEKTDSASALQLINTITQKSYDLVVLGLHNYSRRPANNFAIPNASIYLINELNKIPNNITLAFGNPYAIKNFCDAPNLLACYEDDDLTQAAAFNVLTGVHAAMGKLPVTVCKDLLYGTGITYHAYFPKAVPESVKMSSEKLKQIDVIANDAIAKGAAPGCAVLVAKDGKVVYHKSFGYYNYDKAEPVSINSVYDLASVTKISATTVAVMKLYEEGKIDLNKTIGDYLSWTKGSNKAGLKIRDILLHQAGLNPFIPFYRETIDTATGKILSGFYSTKQQTNYQNRVAENLYIRNDWIDTMYQRILTSKLTVPEKYVYSDNDFIFLGKIVQAVSGLPLNEYVAQTFYAPLGMTTTTFKPREKMSLQEIVPTELEKHFRNQLIRGDVHDEGASMFGGVSGHAGLFSNAYDLVQLYQLLLNGGTLNGTKILKPETIQLFTGYNSSVSRRGLGFDKPEKDNATRKEPYPSKSVSAQTYGHTGFTGTCVWVDPQYNLIYIFLSNRVTPTRNNNKLGQLNIRPSIQEAIYAALQ